MPCIEDRSVPSTLVSKTVSEDHDTTFCMKLTFDPGARSGSMLLLLVNLSL